LPAYTARDKDHNGYTETSVYPALETNIDASIMEFSQEPIAGVKSALSVSRHGKDTPFRHHSVIQQYVEGLLKRNGYEDFVEYSTNVEKVEKLGSGKWRLVLRREGRERDYWWIEEFDAVVVASGHYSVPFVPFIEGLEEFDRVYPGSVVHSKGYRGPEKYRNKVRLPLRALILS
jgi:cation diffusion facilitator CzcD-associated flavoprotein CzcO